MSSEPTLSPSPSTSLAVPIPGPYLIHGLPMQIMEKRQRSAPRPRSPLRSQICVDEEENREEADNKQLEDSEVFAASVIPPPQSFSQAPSVAVNAAPATDGYDPFASYDLECFEDLGLEDIDIRFDIRIIDGGREAEEETSMASAGGAVERANCLSGSAAPVLLSTVPSALPVSATHEVAEDSEALQRPPLTRTDEIHVPETDPATTTLPLPSSTSAPVGLGLLELAGDAHHDAGVPIAGADAAAMLCGDACDGVEAEPIQTMQLMTLESASSISCLAVPMVPPSIIISRSGPSVPGVSGGPDVNVGTNRGGMMPPSLSAAAASINANRNSNANSSTSSLKEPPVQEMCAPTAVMPGPSPTLARTAPPIPSPDAVEDISIFRLDATAAADQMKAASERVDGDEEQYIGNRMLKSSAAIERWRHACADADRDVDSDSSVTSNEGQSQSEIERSHPAVERRDDSTHKDHRDEPVGRRDASPLHFHSAPDATNVATATTESSFDIVESSSSSPSALKTKKSADGLGLGLPSEVPGVVATRATTSLSGPTVGPAQDEMMMSTAPGCVNLAALAREDVDLDPTSDTRSPVIMTSETREGTRFFTRAPVYGKRLLWSVEEEDQEDLALFEFDEDEELRKVDEAVRKMKAQRDAAESYTSMAIPRLALGAGVGAGARALSGAWSRISSLVMSSPAGTSQYDADVEEGCQTSSTSETSLSSDGCSLEEQAPLVTTQTHPALDEVYLSCASALASAHRPTQRMGYVSSFMSRISLSRSSFSSASSSTPMATVVTSPTATGRKSPGFVEHVDAPRGLGLGRLGAAAVKRFQMLF